MSVEDVASLVEKLCNVALKSEQKVDKLATSVQTLAQVVKTTQGGQEAEEGEGEEASAIPPPQSVGPELQAAAKQVQLKYQTVSLEPNLKLHDSRAGISGPENTKVLNILSKCGRLAETCLKVLKKQESDSVNAEGAAELFTLLAAQIGFLQDEFGCLFVSTLGNKQTATLYRALRKNTSSLPPDAVEDLRAAAQVTASLPQPQQQYSGGYGRGYRGYNRGERGRRSRGGRGRGAYPGGYQQQYGYNSPDVYEQMVNHGDPPQ